MQTDTTLDAIDRRILQALQAQGRMSYDELAAGISLSPSATLRRVKRLEDSGVIAGYTALVVPERVGLGLTAYISVRLAKAGDARSPIDTFAAAVQAWPEVVECAALTGEMDYLLRVLVRDMAHYSGFIMDSLLKHPAVQDCKTSFMLRRLKGTTTVPL
ncbi:MAG: Lrp/AsnC family transcriptional regulator [Rubrivivax sp.]|nr:Lrp/AsnC family transcriptional regulator [Rubrivivax sp.]